MSKSILEQVADGVAALIAGGPFAPALVPVVSYPDWDIVLKDHEALAIDVVPVGHPGSELDARKRVLYQVEIDLGVRYKFLPAEFDSTTGRIKTSAVAPYVLLVEQLHEFLAGESQRVIELTGGIKAKWASSKIRSSYSRKLLHDCKQFTGIIRVTYRVWKNV